MRKILTVALLASALAAPAFAADLSTTTSSEATTTTTAPVAVKSGVAVKTEKKVVKKHSHKAKKVEAKAQ